MALGTITPATPASLGAPGDMPSAPVFHALVSMPGDDAYTTGGTADFAAAIAAALGKEAIVLLYTITVEAGVYSLAYDPANDTLVVKDASGAEVADATDLSATTMTFWCVYH